MRLARQTLLQIFRIYGGSNNTATKNILALLMSFSVCPLVILMSTTTAHNNNKQQYTLVTSVLENRVQITLSGKHGVIIEWFLADFVCGFETNCCLTDEGKYSRTDSSPFTHLHNYIITYLGRSLAWWFWLLAVILLVLFCFSIRPKVERFSVLSFNLRCYWKLPQWKTLWFNHDIEYHLLAVGVHLSSFWLSEELLKEMREQVHAGALHGQAKKILYWITL